MITERYDKYPVNILNLCRKEYVVIWKFATFVTENTSFVFSLLLCALACESRCHFCSMSKVKSLI
nr:MAG TPA: Radical SAM superfamily [Caudoviricetes sp.]